MVVKKSIFEKINAKAVTFKSALMELFECSVWSSIRGDKSRRTIVLSSLSLLVRHDKLLRNWRNLSLPPRSDSCFTPRVGTSSSLPLFRACSGVLRNRLLALGIKYKVIFLVGTDV